jgi:hypothetical protein
MCDMRAFNMDKYLNKFVSCWRSLANWSLLLDTIEEGAHACLKRSAEGHTSGEFRRCQSSLTASRRITFIEIEKIVEKSIVGETFHL